MPVTTNGTGRTCGNCWYFEPIQGHPARGENLVGSCLVEPPRAFPTVMPQSALQVPVAPQAALQGVDPPVRAGRRACRHWVDAGNWGGRHG
jgi:hypothetical protein